MDCTVNEERGGGISHFTMEGELGLIIGLLSFEAFWRLLLCFLNRGSSPIIMLGDFDMKVIIAGTDSRETYHFEDG